MSYYQNNRSTSRSRPHSSNRSFTKSRRPAKDYIHPSKFVKSAQPVSDHVYVPTYNFTDFNINPIIKNNIEKLGFKVPSPIQDQAIPVGLAGRDIVGIANTGTGKTAAFAIPLINRLVAERNSQAIVLAPTRELAQQIEEQFRQLATGSGLTGALLIGGVAIGPQLRELRYNPSIIIGTPGRVKDHLDRRSLKLNNCNIIVLDEVDRMLDMGFISDIRHILNLTNPTKQGYYFSATLDNKVKSVIQEFSHDPTYISVKDNETNDNVDQNVVAFNSDSDKISKLHDILIQDTTLKTLIFEDTHRSVEKLSKELELRGFSSESIHGGKSQSQRQTVLKKFKDNRIKVLVATDVASRGLDISDISHVVNYSSPQSYDDYVHRIGRTGRAGKTGYALTFISN